jgi:hypothetical protein
MIHVSNRKLKKIFMCLFCLGLLLFFSGPSMAAGLNLASSGGSALIDWRGQGVVFRAVDNVGNEVIPNWVEKNSFSSAWSGVNGKETDPGLSDFFEGTGDPGAPIAWVGTAFTASFAGFSGSAIGNADTADPATAVDPNALVRFNRNFAASNVNLTKFGDADVFIAQAVLEGPFTVDTDCTFTVTVPYTLLQNLSSKFGFAAVSDVAVSLTVYDLNTYDPATGNSKILPGSVSVSSLKQDKPFWKNPPVLPQSGNITMTVNLIANYPPPVQDDQGNPVPIVYDFEAAASTIASAWVPYKPIFFPPCWWWLNRVRGI